jgi:hypothetical protein
MWRPIGGRGRRSIGEVARVRAEAVAHEDQRVRSVGSAERMRAARADCVALQPPKVTCVGGCLGQWHGSHLVHWRAIGKALPTRGPSITRRLSIASPGHISPDYPYRPPPVAHTSSLTPQFSLFQTSFIQLPYRTYDLRPRPASATLQARCTVRAPLAQPPNPIVAIT